jgi:ketosteroid isomerase-like protein
VTGTNVDVVRRLTDAINGGDIEAVLESFDPQVRFEPLRAPIQGAYSGHAGVREWWADTQESFAEFRLEPDEIRDLADDRVLAIVTLHVRGQGSGAEADISSASIIAFRDRMIVELKDHGDRSAALRAADLAG